MRKRFVPMIVAVAMLISYTCPAAALGQTDDSAVSRAEFVNALYQALGAPETSGAGAFTDVPADSAYAKAISWAVQGGVISGLGGGRFAPELKVNREQAAAILLNYAQSKGAGPVGAWAVRLDYPDLSDISEWALAGIMYSKTHGIVTDKPDGRFDPKGFVTLSEAAGWSARILAVIKSIVDKAEPLTLSDTDYSDRGNWLRFGGDRRKDVDIFVVYPTLTESENEADKPFVRLNSVMMRVAATLWLRDMDDVASAYANVYAPLYRQVNLAMLPVMPNDDAVPHFNSVPREDIFAAFAYYLENVNKNERPFIILGLSQGSHMAAELATTFLGNEEYSAYNKNHIITYAAGMSVTGDSLEKNSFLKFSQSPEDTGVIVSWNVTAPSEIKSEAYKVFGTWREGALVTNPITWESNETPATAVPFAKDYMSPTGVRSIKGRADAVADKELGLLLVTTVDESGYPVMLGGRVSRFHGFDFWFFSDSIKKNIKDRIVSFNLKG